MHDVRSDRSNRFRPPAPPPRREAWRPLALFKALRKNPIEIWTEAHFEQPIVLERFAFGRVALVSEPTAIRKVLVENSGHYRKSALQTRVLSVALRDGLLTVEGDQWRSQRRSLAPLFGRRAVMRYAPTMVAAVEAMMGRWRARGGDQFLDIGTEMNRLALDGLARTCFSDGLGGDPEAMRVAMMTYFEIAGRIDPFDFLGLSRLHSAPDAAEGAPVAPLLRPGGQRHHQIASVQARRCAGRGAARFADRSARRPRS